MAATKCASCKSAAGFEMAINIGVKRSDKQYNAIQCVSCGAVATIVEGWHLSSALWKIMEKLGIDPRSV